MSTVLTPVTHPVRLTERINRIEPSAPMAAVAEAEKLRQQGPYLRGCVTLRGQGSGRRLSGAVTLRLRA